MLYFCGPRDGYVLGGIKLTAANSPQLNGIGANGCVGRGNLEEMG